MEILATLLGVIVGSLLTVGWEALKDKNQNEELRKRVRTLLILEITHNVQSLSSFRDAYRAEEKLYNETMVSDGMGGYDVKGDPIGVLRRYRVDDLSQLAWQNQISDIHLAFDSEDISSMFNFYGTLRSVITEIEAVQRTSITQIVFFGPESTVESVIGAIGNVIDTMPKFAQTS